MIDRRRMYAAAVILLASGAVLVRADDSIDGVLLRVDAGGPPSVSRLTTPAVQLGAAQPGLIIWDEGGQERWQFFTGRWTRPQQPLASPPDAVLDTLSRGRQESGGEQADWAMLTTQLEELRGHGLSRKPVFHDGDVQTPAKDSWVLNPRLTIRRWKAQPDAKLPLATAVIAQNNVKIVSLTFKPDQTKVAWADVPGLPKGGLRPGSYTLQFNLGERTTFHVEDAERFAEVMERPNELARLLGKRGDPLYAQTVVEHLLAQSDRLGKPRPYLNDALDVLDPLRDEDQTYHLQRLRRHVLKWLDSPGRAPAVPHTLGEPTQIEAIDHVRHLIAAGRWADAFRALAAVQSDGSALGRRTRALTSLYRGVALAESGPTKGEDADAAFRQARRPTCIGRTTPTGTSCSIGARTAFTTTPSRRPPACGGRCSRPWATGTRRARNTSRP